VNLSVILTTPFEKEASVKESDVAMWIMGIVLGLSIGGIALMDFIKMMMEEVKPEEFIDKDMIELPEEQMEQKMALEGTEEKEEAPSDKERAA
jgi:hypothetical protein